MNSTIQNNKKENVEKHKSIITVIKPQYMHSYTHKLVYT